MRVKEKGTLTFKSEIASGVSKAGNTWQSMNIVMEVRENNYIRNVALKAFGDEQVNLIMTLPMNSTIDVEYEVSAREYNGKWYNDVNIKNIIAESVPGEQKEEVMIDTSKDLPF